VRFIWQARAIADVARLVEYIAEENPVAARQIGQELVIASSK
jgi:plasmid stabilization system protein ParE